MLAQGSSLLFQVQAVLFSCTLFSAVFRPHSMASIAFARLTRHQRRARAMNIWRSMVSVSSCTFPQTVRLYDKLFPAQNNAVHIAGPGLRTTSGSLSPTSYTRAVRYELRAPLQCEDSLPLLAYECPTAVTPCQRSKAVRSLTRRMTIKNGTDLRSPKSLLCTGWS